MVRTIPTDRIRRPPGLSLSVRFLIAAGAVMLVGMLVVGSWVGELIKQSALATLVETEVPHVRVPLSRLVQDPGFGPGLEADMRAELDALAAELKTDEGVMSVKLWAVDGLLLYSSLGPDNEPFDVEEVTRAAAGETVSSFEHLEHEESAAERELKLPLIEIYFPIYSANGGEVLAVGEVYEDATMLQRQIEAAKSSSWILAGGASAAVLAVLYLIVRGGSRTIEAQEAALQEQVAAARKLAADNEHLRLEADQARLDASSANEELLGRIGADLHDGPVQMLSLLLLSLPENGPDAGTKRDPVRLGKEIIAELRQLSVGLVLPEIETMPLADCLKLAISRHEKATGTTVRTDLGELPGDVPMAVRVCLYRVVQESLNNAARHARGAEVLVTAGTRDDTILVTVEDNGSGLAAPAKKANRDRLGLVAMRNRVAALRGHLVVEDRLSAGMRIKVSIPRSSNRGLA